MLIANINAERDPIIVNKIASCPFPSRSSLCPGKTDKAIDGSGAPRYIEGIESKKVWVTAIAIMKTASVIGSRMFSNINEIERSNVHTVLMCNPGISPVRIPNKIPDNVAKIISIIF